MTKAIAIVAAITIVLVLIISAIAYALLDEALLKRELSKALGRDVTFAHISPALLHIKVDGLGVGNLPGFDSNSFFTATEVDLQYSIFSIFKGKLVINRAVLSHAHISLEQRGDTISNYADLAKRDKDGSILEVRALELDHVDVSFRHDSVIVEVKEISGEITNLASVPNLFNLSGRIFGAPFKAVGEINPLSYAGRIKLNLDQLALDAFNLKFDTVDLAGLAATVDGELGFSTETFAWSGSANVKGLADVSGQVAGAWSDPPSSRGQVTIAALAENLARIKPARVLLEQYHVHGGFRVTVPLTGNRSGNRFVLPSSASGELLGLSTMPPQIGKLVEGITGKFRVSPVEAVLEGISFKASGTPISVTGRVGLAKMTLDLAIKSPRAEVSDLIALAPISSVPDGVKASGPVALDVRITGTVDAPLIAGRVDLAGLRVTASPPAVKKSATFEDLRGALLFDGKLVTMEHLAARYGASKISIAGTYALDGGAMNLAVAGLSLDVGALAALAPTSPLPPGISIGGNASIDLKMTGRSESPSTNGWIKMEGMSIGLSDPRTDLENVRGRLDLAGDEVTLTNVTAKMKSMAVAVSGTYHRKSEALNLKVKADNIVLAELPADLGTQMLLVKGAASFDGDVTGRASSPVVRGDVRSEQLSLYGVALSNVIATILLDSPRVDVGKLRAGILGGEISGSAGMNIFSATRPFKLDLSGTALDFSQALALGSRFAGLSISGISGGKVTGKMEISSSNFDDKSAMSGSGSAEAKDVDLGNVKIIAALSQALMAGQLRSISGLTSALSNSETKKYENIRGAFRIEHGRLNINQTLRLATAGEYALGFHGSVGLDGSVDGLLADVDLPKAWFGNQALKIAQLLTGATSSGNKVTLPFAFAGSLAAPTPKPVFNFSPQNLLQTGLELLSGRGEQPPVADNSAAASNATDTSNPTAVTVAVETPVIEPARNSRQRAIDLIGDILRKR